MSSCTEMHGGQHCMPWHCPDCGRWMADSWIEEGGGQNGWNQYYGGICPVHGEWSDSAA